MKSLLLSLLVVISFNSFAGGAGSKPLAVIWKGKGVCPFWCASGAKKMARKAGFKTIYVNSKTKNLDEILERAKLWVQPGGQSIDASKDMGPKIRESIRSFVHKGGGYVGFCAGMLLTTKKIALTDQPGLGILPGNINHLSKVEDLKRDPTILKVDFVTGQRRDIYFSGGPFLVQALEGVEVESYYSTGQIAGVSTTYGKGKVLVYGYHAETPGYWKLLRGLKDRDGRDYKVAIDMMKRAIK